MVTINGKTVGVDIFIGEDIDELNNEETLDYKIAVMQWYRDGNEIEYWDEFDDEWVKIVEPPVWEWGSNDYRAVPKPKYRPYKKADIEWIGKAVRCESKPQVQYLITGIDMLNCENGKIVQINNTWRDGAAFFEYFTWLDGSPCGELVNGN